MNKLGKLFVAATLIFAINHTSHAMKKKIKKQESILRKRFNKYLANQRNKESLIIETSNKYLVNKKKKRNLKERHARYCVKCDQESEKYRRAKKELKQYIVNKDNYKNFGSSNGDFCSDRDSYENVFLSLLYKLNDSKKLYQSRSSWILTPKDLTFNNGENIVTLFAKNRCCGMCNDCLCRFLTIKYYLNVSIAHNKKLKSMFVSPNFSGKTLFSIALNKKMFDILGHLIKRENIQLSSNDKIAVSKTTFELLKDLFKVETFQSYKDNPYCKRDSNALSYKKHLISMIDFLVKNDFLFLNKNGESLKTFLREYLAQELNKQKQNLDNLRNGQNSTSNEDSEEDSYVSDDEDEEELKELEQLAHDLENQHEIIAYLEKRLQDDTKNNLIKIQKNTKHKFSDCRIFCGI